MNVHDYAHQLARALKESSQYQEYKKLERQVSENQQNKTMIKNFRKHQIEIQGLQMTGQEIEESKMKELQDLHNQLMQNPMIAEYIHAEYKLTQMIGDIYKIIGEALNLDMND